MYIGRNVFKLGQKYILTIPLRNLRWGRKELKN
jgi:hypothetical protein